MQLLRPKIAKMVDFLLQSFGSVNISIDPVPDMFKKSSGKTSQPSTHPTSQPFKQQGRGTSSMSRSLVCNKEAGMSALHALVETVIWVKLWLSGFQCKQFSHLEKYVNLALLQRSNPNY